MAISQAIMNNLARIGASFPADSTEPAIHILTREVVWPKRIEFNESIERMRQYLAERGSVDYSAAADEVIRELMPPIYSLGFIQWDEDWDIFPSVDPTRYYMFAINEYYYFFIAENPDDPTDPLVFSLDHEESYLAPSLLDGFSVSQFMSIVEASCD